MIDGSDKLEEEEVQEPKADVDAILSEALDKETDKNSNRTTEVNEGVEIEEEEKDSESSIRGTVNESEGKVQVEEEDVQELKADVEVVLSEASDKEPDEDRHEEECARSNMSETIEENQNRDNKEDEVGKAT